VTLFEQFVRERRYLFNISLSTVSWYSHAMPSNGNPANRLRKPN
jgi:hypothetical protein